MLEPDATWTGPWVARNIKDEDGVLGVDVIESQVLCVRRRDDSFMLGTTAVERVCSTALRTMPLETLSFIVNVHKDPFWTVGAIGLMSQHSIAFGGMGDLYEALSAWEDVRQYINREFRYVERALGQHHIVETMTRVQDRKYILRRRRGLPDFVIVLMNEYELAKCHVRMAVERYGPFDAILITNSYGGATTQATEIAGSMGIGIFGMADLMRRINEP